jgi:hypothetical protein
MPDPFYDFGSGFSKRVFSQVRSALRFAPGADAAARHPHRPDNIPNQNIWQTRWLKPGFNARFPVWRHPSSGFS